MLKTARQNKICKHIVSLCFVLFALSPCIAKQGLLNPVMVEFDKPLSQSKTTTHTSSCSYSQSDSYQVSVNKQIDNKNHSEPVDLIIQEPIAPQPDKTLGRQDNTSSGNSPPKYILYKRLKLDIA